MRKKKLIILVYCLMHASLGLATELTYENLREISVQELSKYGLQLNVTNYEGYSEDVTAWKDVSLQALNNTCTQYSRVEFSLADPSGGEALFVQRSQLLNDRFSFFVRSDHLPFISIWLHPKNYKGPTECNGLPVKYNGSVLVHFEDLGNRK